jgi:predicted kinase
MARVMIALCGLAFSGKSTIARRVAPELDCALISYDAINAARGFDGGTVIADVEWEKTSMMAAVQARTTLTAGRGVVIDDTFSHRFLRERFRKLAQSVGVPFVLLFVDTPMSVIEARIADNTRTDARTHIAPSVFAHHRDRFQFPDPDENAVRLVSSADLDRWLAEWRGRLAI